MPIIYFIRHGQTDWNAKSRLQGQTETSLNETGRAQAARNGRVLAGLLNDPVRFEFVSSSIGRARATMEIIRRELDMEPGDYSLDDRLKEINYGDWEGHSWDELKEKDPDGVKRRFADSWHSAAPNGESYADLSARSIDWLQSCKSNTVAVSHGGVHRCLRGFIENMDPQTISWMNVPQDKILKIEGSSLTFI